MSPKKNPALPLKDVMAAIDKKDRNFYINLSAEQKKAFIAVVYKVEMPQIISI